MAEAKFKVDPNLLFKAGLVVAGYFVIVKPLLQYFGLKDDKDDKAAAENIENFKGWNPRYFTDVSAAKKKTTYITTAGADKIAKLIYDSFNWYNDSEEQIFGALRLLVKNQVQLSQVSYRYALMYKVDLGREIQARLSDDEFTQVVNIVNKLPAL